MKVSPHVEEPETQANFLIVNMQNNLEYLTISFLKKKKKKNI